MRTGKILIPLTAIILISVSFLSLIQGEGNEEEWTYGDPSLMEMEPSGHFTENLGQWDESISFVGDTNTGRIGIGTHSIFHELRTYYPDREMEVDHDENLLIGYLLKVDMVGSNDVVPVGSEALSFPSSFFRGNDPTKWVSGARSYQKVHYSGIWEGVDLDYIISEARPKYTFTLQPCIDVDTIRMDFKGQSSMNVGGDGATFVFEDGIEFRDSGLLAYYQDDGTVIPARFIQDGPHIGFALKDRDLSRAVVIDPIVTSTFYGGAGSDTGHRIKTDDNGDYYIAGKTYSVDFPTTPGSLKQGYSGEWGDMFVIKMNKSLKTRDYSFMFGGTHAEEFGDLEIYNGQAVASGFTQSDDFPTTPGCYENESAGGWRDPYLLKINSSGTGLIFSTIITGSSDEFGYGIDIEENGNIIYVGYTGSDDFPVTSDAYSSTKNGSYDAFILKMLPNGTDIVYSSYFGGNNFDNLYDVEILDSGDVMFYGGTLSNDLYFPSDSYDSTASSSGNGLVIRMDINISKINAATLFGSGIGNGLIDLEIKNNGNVALLCYGTGYPTTSGTFNPSSNGGNDFVLAELDINLTTLDMCTYVGGSLADDNGKLSIDSKDNFIISGYTQSTDYPTTPGAYDETYNGTNNVNGIVSKIDESGKYLMYSTFFGGSGRTYTRDFVLVSDFNVVITGTTNSPDFPVTAGAYDTTIGGGPDIFITEFSFLSAPTSPMNLTGTKGYDWIHLQWEAPKDDGGRPILGYELHTVQKGGLPELTTSLSLNTFEYNVTGLKPDGDYLFYVIGRNIIGLSSPSNSIRFHDTIAPWLGMDLTQSDHSPLGTTTFKIIASDNTFIDSAYVEYWIGDRFGNMNRTMERDDQLHSFILDHPDQVFEMRYMFRFNDTSDNWFNSRMFSFNVTGEVKPSIVQDLTPSTIKAGEVLNFKVEASDNDEVKSVHLNYQSNSGLNNNVTMDMVSPNLFEYKLPTKRYSLTPISYKYFVMDASGHWNQSQEMTVIILDVDSPVLSYDRTPLQAFTGEELLFEISVSDNQRINETWVKFSVDDGPYENATMEKKQGGFFEHTILVPHTLGRIRYSFHALDENGNIGWLPEKEIPIIDMVKPSIIVDRTNITGPTGHQVLFEFELDDNIKVGDAVVEYWFGTGDHRYLELFGASIFTGQLEISSGYKGSISYSVKVSDTSGNYVKSEIAMLEIFDNELPEMLEDFTVGTAETGGQILFKLKVSDNSAIKLVKVEYGWSGEISETALMDGEVDDSYFSWSVTVKEDDVSPMNYRFRIEDTSGNMIATDIREITVVDTIFPEITPPSQSVLTISTTTEINILVEATDNIGVESLIISGSPIEPVSGRIRGYIDEPGHYFIDVKAVDAQGNEASYSFILRVKGDSIDETEESSDTWMLFPPVISLVLLMVALIVLFTRKRSRDHREKGPVDLSTLKVQNGNNIQSQSMEKDEDLTEIKDLFGN